MVTATDRIDRVLTHKLWGTLAFAAVMLAVFHVDLHRGRTAA